MISTLGLSRARATWRFAASNDAPARAFIGLLCLWWLLLLLFNAFPQIDIYASKHFFVQEACKAAATVGGTCGYFPYRQETYLGLLRILFFRLPYLIAPMMLWKLAVCYWHCGTTFNVARARAFKVALGSLIIGPVILVNVLLKAHWGRPRPWQTLDFGGHLDFVHAGSMAGKCMSNCSFVSGEAAGAGWVFCLIFLIPQPARSALALPLSAVSFLAPAMRVAFGAHYLSDVILGWLSSIVIFAGLLALTDSPQGKKKSEI
ncbi:phosphatase PAP2 family protein [Rhizobium tibeticum]|uniref:phosphatase PAP2 family protein n=1 Tax=Rhizobium tibeticum TaxID=501024 RepID=UPI001FCE2C3D|nr:phosphatase PAP2 family protein [Rhizobium tibeticum]